MARAKNTDRAEARKRSRDAQRAEMAALDEDEQYDELDDQPDEAPPARPAMFQMPNIREDIKALPSIFREKPLVWLPFGLVLIGFVLRLAFWGMSVDLQQWVLLYIQFFFVPQGLFAYFIAGFIAPRASYLVGGLLGALSGILYPIGEILTAPIGTDIPPGDAIAAVFSSALTGIVLGAFAGGFAAWYRNFLRNMQQNGQQRRAAAESKERAKRREARQQSRSVFKQRSN